MANTSVLLLLFLSSFFQRVILEVPYRHGPLPSSTAPFPNRARGWDSAVISHSGGSGRIYSAQWQHLSFVYMQCNANDSVLFFGNCCSMDPEVYYHFCFFGGRGVQPVKFLKFEKLGQKFCVPLSLKYGAEQHQKILNRFWTTTSRIDRDRITKEWNKI